MSYNGNMQQKGQRIIGLWCLPYLLSPTYDTFSPQSTKHLFFCLFVFCFFFLPDQNSESKRKIHGSRRKKNKIKPYKSTSFILQLKFLLSIFLEEHGESWSTEWKSLYSSVLPVLCVIAIPFCSSLTTFLWQCNWQASAVKTSNSSFFIWRHFVGFNQGFNWQSGSGWVAPGAGAKRGHWLSWDSHLCSPPPPSFLSFSQYCSLFLPTLFLPPDSDSYLLLVPQIFSHKSICLFFYSVFLFYTFVLSVIPQKHTVTHR